MQGLVKNGSIYAAGWNFFAGKRGRCKGRRLHKKKGLPLTKGGGPEGAEGAIRLDKKRARRLPGSFINRKDFIEEYTNQNWFYLLRIAFRSRSPNMAFSRSSGERAFLEPLVAANRMKPTMM